MPDSKPGPGPDQPAPEPKGAQARPPRAAARTADPKLPAAAEAPPKVWETGEDLDGGRIPGTRRLYLAGVLAVAVLASTVTAIAILDQTEDKESQGPQTTSASQPVVPDFTPPEGPTTEPSGKSGLASPQPSPEEAASDGKGDSSEEQGRASKPIKQPPKPSAPNKPPAKPPASTSLKSVQAVNYPDRYWHFSDGTGRLDQVSSGSSAETRQDSTFTLVPGLADSNCVSFSTGDGGYVRHLNFQLRTGRHDGSELFKKDATFCPRPSSHSGAVMLEAVNFPGSFVRHRNFQLRLERYEHSGLYRADSAFRLVDGLS
ncbi:AbfB domain-containing protein [Streptomyces sp. NBC_00286]|uniref:AbfB domain-containing protein n=1 Tax=Streptomyces sp. NBC_00286 TaxID=2975701 RepID=UPI002E2D151A|nr:AbfB domain-containing protein [Streptomyces sp. NBC_00286]